MFRSISYNCPTPLLLFYYVVHLHFSRSDRKRTDSSSSAKKSKSKLVSRLSHDLFASGSFQDNDSGDMFSPTESTKELPKATPPPTVAAKPASSRKDSLFGKWRGPALWLRCMLGFWDDFSVNKWSELVYIFVILHFFTT